MKIATWNVNSIKVRLAQILEWVNIWQPDILALQETKITDDKFPINELAQAGYNVIFSGQKTYNGVAILSKANAEEVITDIPNLADPQRRLLFATIAGVRIVNLYIPNGAALDSEKYQYKLDWLTKVQLAIKKELTQYKHLVVLGDFNIAPHERDVYDSERWEDSVLFAPQMRQIFADFLDLGLVDSFRLFEQPEQSYSWWDYRTAAFRGNRGLRIDHILASEALAKLCIAASIDREPRSWERPSDHTPVIAEFDL